MTQGDVLETLRVVIEADKTRLTQGLTAATQETRQAGQQMGQGLRTGLTATLPALGGVGAQAGQQFGEGFTRDAQGRLRDSRGKFIKSGQELGQGLADGLKQSSPALDSAMNGLTARLGGGGQGIGAAFGRVTAGAGGLTAGLTGIVGIAGPAGAAIAGVGAAAAAVVAPVNAAINEFAKFEYGLAKVSTLTDKTPQQLRATGQEVLKLSGQMGASFQSLNEGLYDILGAGVKGTESMSAALGFLEQAAKLAKAGATDTAVATDVLTSVLNAYQMSAADTASVSDKLFKAVDLGKMSFEQLAQSLGMVTAISSQAGVSLDEVLAALATMTANGVQASSSVDYLRSLISSITKPSQEAAGLADKLGIAFNDQALKAKGLTGVLQEVMDKTGGSTAKLGILFGGVEAVTAATSIASGEFKRMAENVGAIGTAAGTTDTAYGKMASTVQEENDKLAANWKRLMVGMGEVFAPFKLDVLSGLNDLLNKANEVLEKWMQARRLKSSGQDVLNLERELEGQQAARQNAYARLRDPNVDAAEKDRIRTDFLPKILAEINRLKGEIAEAKAENAVIRAEASAAALGTTSGTLTGAGALLPGQERGDALNAAIVAATASKTGNRLADEVAGWCARWVKLTLEKAEPSAKAEIQKWFGGDAGTVRDRLAGSDMLRKDLGNLQPGDVVVYDKDHIGIYVGNGKVKGNNLWGVKNGREAVSTEGLHSLGSIAGFVRLGEVPGVRGPASSGNTPPPPGDDKESPITAAQVVKAQQLLQAVEKAQEALKKKPGDVGLTKALDTATQSMKGWSEASKENTRALAAVRAGQDGVNRSSGAYIATSADLKKWGSDALRLYKDLEVAQKSGSSQAIATAERNIATWMGESKARQAVMTAETAAYKARQTQREEERRKTQQSGEDMADAAAKWAEDQDRRAREQAQIRARIADTNRQLTVSAAQAASARLAELNRQELAAFKGNATQKAAIIQRQSQDEYEARVRVLAAIRNKEIREAQNRTGLPEETRNEMIRQAKARYADGVQEARGTRLDTMRDAAQAIRDEAEAARREGEQTATDAARWAEEQETRDRERAQLLNRLANERRDLDVATAQASLARIEELNRQELAAFKGTGAQRLALVRRQAQEEYDARVAAADVARRVALEKSANTGGRNQASRDRGIEAAYTQAELTARGTRDSTIRQATEQQTTSIRNLRGEYSKLAEEIRRQVAAGEFGSEERQRATAAFNALGRAAAAAGLTTETHVEGARRSVWGLIEAGQDLSTTLNLLSSGAAGVNAETGELVYATDAELRGIGVAVEDTTDNFFDLQNAIDGVGMLSRDELGELITQAGLAEDAADALWAAWNRVNEGLTGGPITAGDNLAGRGITNEPDAFDPATGNLSEGEAERLAAAFWGRPLEELQGIFNSLSQKDSPLGNLLQGAIQAQQLLSRLEIATDPAEIQGIAAEVAGFLASDVGKALPPTVSGALEAGVKDADAYRAILADATAEGITDGWERAGKAGAAGTPGNRFTEFSDALWGMGDALKDPVTLEAVTGELEKARAAGELTGAQLLILKEIIASINAQPLELAPTADETRFEGIVKQFDDLTASLEAGEISLEEYSNQAGPLSVKLDRLAVAAQAANKPELAQAYAMLAAELRNLMPVLEDAADKLDDLAQGAVALGDGLASIFNGFGMGEWGKLSSGLGNLFKTVQDGRKALSAIGPAFAKSFGAGLGAVGSFLGVVGAGVNLVGQVGDAILNLSPAFRAWKKNLLEVAELQGKAASMNGGLLGNPYAAALKEDAGKREQLANAGFWKRAWWAISGSAPKVMEEGAARLKSHAAEIFADLGQTISNTLESSLMDAFLKADFSGVEEAMNKALDTFVVKTAIHAVIKKSQLTRLVEAYADEAVRGGDTADEAAAIRAEMGNVSRAFQGIAPGLPGYGSGAGGGLGGTGQGGSLFGNAPGVQLGIPRVEVTLPDALMRPLGEFAGAVPIFSAASTTMLQAAQLLLRLGTGNGNPPPLSGNGAL